jgi:hypothetical protein
MLAFLPGILHQLGTSRLTWWAVGLFGTSRRASMSGAEIDSVPATYEDVRDRAYREGVG